MSCENGSTQKIGAKVLYSLLTKKKEEIALSSNPTYIYAKDFSEGTYIIDKPGYYVLKENIIFSPNADNDYLPKMNNPKYRTLGYSLGFFACLVIAAKDVYLNLNGFSISASEEFILAQRFFSIIELADAPFLGHEGPSKFCTTLKSAENVIVANGTLGKSSHHGIHGNLANNILLENLKILNFEFVGIALNGGHCIILKDINIGPNKQDVPVLATYSAARFAKLFTNHVLSKDILPEDISNSLKEKLATLQYEMDETVADVLSGTRVNSDLFRNESRLPDGNVYGVLVKDEGFAVNDFVNAAQVISEKKKKTNNVFLNNVNVENLVCRVDEVIALSTKGGLGATVDVAGSVLQIDKITSSEKYVPTALSELQLFLAKISLEYKIPLGKNNISLDLLSWANNSENVSNLLKKGYKYKCGGDSMAHMNKGIIAFRFDALNNLFLRKCKLDKIVNTAVLGNDKLAGNYLRSHDAAKRNGYFGADATGVNISYCSDTKLSRCDFRHILAKHGNAIGVNVIFNSDVSIQKCLIENIKAGTLKDRKWKGEDYSGQTLVYSEILPNKIPIAIGIRIEKDCVVDLDKVKIHDLRSPREPIKILRE
jgi:hypothetical protein